MARLDPASCINRTQSWPTRYPGTALLLGSMILVYLVELSVAWYDGDVSHVVLDGLPTSTLEPLVKFSPDQVWWHSCITLVSSTLAHGAWDHVLANIGIVAVFGPSVERWLGRWAHVSAFFAIAAAASLAQGLVTGGSMWGASAPAIAYGIYWPMAGYEGSLFPEPETFETQWMVWGLRFVVFLFFLLLALPGPGPVNPGTSHVAHLFGLLCGVLLALTARSTDRLGSLSDP